MMHDAPRQDRARRGDRRAGEVRAARDRGVDLEVVERGRRAEIEIRGRKARVEHRAARFHARAQRGNDRESHRELGAAVLEPPPVHAPVYEDRHGLERNGWVDDAARLSGAASRVSQRVAGAL